MVHKDVTIFIGEQEFDIDDFDNVRQNRFIPEYNFKRGNYIRQIVGSSYEDLHHPAEEHEVERCPRWRKHQGDFPSNRPRRGYSKALKATKRMNELWWY